MLSCAQNDGISLKNSEIDDWNRLLRLNALKSRTYEKLTLRAFQNYQQISGERVRKMPDINLQNPVFAAIPPGITINNQAALLTQNAANACGAYALVAAVGAFQTFPINAQITYAGQNLPAISSTIAMANTFRELAAAVYAMSGILNPPPNVQPPQPPNPELMVPVPPNIYPINGYNSLAVLAAAAISLNRVPTIFATQAGFAMLSPFYPGEEDRCIAVVGVENVHIGGRGATVVTYQAPTATQTQVIVVANVGGGLHFVARGSDGGYYDPAPAVPPHTNLGNMWGPPDNPGFNAATGGLYNFGGVWITIS